MLVSFLLVALIVVILFREEIRLIIGALLILGVLYVIFHGIRWHYSLPIGMGLVTAAAWGYQTWSRVREEGKRKESEHPAQQATLQQTTPLTAAATQESQGNGWYYIHLGQPHGPVSEENLLLLLKSGKLPKNTPIRWSGIQQWSQADSIWANRF